VVPACLILAVPPAAAVQSYGGLGLYRAFLFALPWLAFFGATAFTERPSRDRHWRARFVPLTLATSALAAFLLLACFGLDLGNRVAPDEVRAEAWLEGHAEPGAQVLHGADGPSFLTARYPGIDLAGLLVARPGFRGHRLGTADVPRLEDLAAQLRRGREVFVVLSRRQEDYARLNGLLPRGAITSFTQALDASPAFRLVYQRPTAWIYEYRPRSGLGGVR
jgi:hypothetical protein